MSELGLGLRLALRTLRSGELTLLVAALALAVAAMATVSVFTDRTRLALEREANRLLGRTFVTQPALFCIEYALAQLWMSWGVVPSAMIGHSIGEYVAACLANVFSLEDALALVAARGQLMQELSPGAMLAVMLSETETRSLLGNGLALAAVNSAKNCV